MDRVTHLDKNLHTFTDDELDKILSEFPDHHLSIPTADPTYKIIHNLIERTKELQKSRADAIKETKKDKRDTMLKIIPIGLAVVGIVITVMLKTCEDTKDLKNTSPPAQNEHDQESTKHKVSIGFIRNSNI